MRKWHSLARTVITIFLIHFLTLTVAQAPTDAPNKHQQKYLSRDSTFTVGTRVSLAYLGSMIYPGFSAGTEIPKTLIEIHEQRKQGEKVIYKENFYSINLGMYHHGGFHNNLFLTGSYHKNRISEKGYFMGYSVGLGVSRTFLDGTTYRINSNGNVETKHLAGNYYFSILAGFEFGRDFQYAKQEKPIHIFLKPSVLVMMPYSGFIYTRPMMEIGVKYRMDNFLTHKAKHTLKIQK